jgi:molybdate/tungstate transport system permease protein
MTDRRAGLFALLSVVLLGYLLFPFLAFLRRSGEVAVLASLSEPGGRAAIRNSLLTAPVATLLATVFGVPLAYTLARSSFRGKRIVEAFVVLPIVLPPVVAGAMLLSGVGRFTPVGAFFATRGLSLTDSLAGVVLAQTFVAAPFVIITARAGFSGVDRRLEQASRSMGYGPIETFGYVSLPLAKNMVLAGVVLTFARAIGEFGATMMVAYYPRTMPVQIWVSFVSLGLDAAYPVAIVLVVVSVAALVILNTAASNPWE